MIIPSTIGYLERGVLYRTDTGGTVLEFDPRYNEALHQRLLHVTALIGLEATIDGNDVTIDGTLYTITYPEDQGYYAECRAAMVAHLGITDQQARDILGPLGRGLKEHLGG